MTNTVTQQEVDDCNADRERDGDPPVTAEQIAEVREQTQDVLKE